MLLQRRYEIILYHNYFITVVYYYRTHPILFRYFFSIPTFFYLLNFFITGFFCYGIYNFISDQMFILCYGLDTTIVGSIITLILCAPFLCK